MICPKCQQEYTQDLLPECRIPTCAITEPLNTSGKVSQLFNISGNGFTIDNISMTDMLTDLYFYSLT